MDVGLFNIKIKQHRKALGLTQEEFAQKLQSSLGLVKMYETGTRSPSKKMKEKICNICSISLAELEGLADKEKLKKEISSKISNIQIEEKEQEHIREDCQEYFYDILNYKEKKNFKSNVTNIVHIIVNTIEEFIRNNYLNIDSKEQLKSSSLDEEKNKFLNINTSEMNFISVKQANTLIDNNSLYKFLKTNIEFIISIINELQFNIISSKYTIPLVTHISNKWEDNVNNAIDFIEIPASLQDNKYVALCVTNELANQKYEVGNILIIEWNSDYKYKDDIILLTNGNIQIRRIYITSKAITLVPLNISSDTETYTTTEFSEKEIQIIGKIVGIKI